LKVSPATKAFQNAKLQAMTEKVHISSPKQITASKEDLMKTLNMSGMDRHGVEIYG